MDERIKKFIDAGEEKKLFPLFSPKDLAERWQLTVQGVHWLSKNHKNFPKPARYMFNSKDTRGMDFYPLYEVLRYEKERGANLESD